ncbi:hypothetical protein KAS08_04190 [Candidatus Pacearchaeota archaeon]|nr:hypothetical protein [Candidatus Pacearchaeota archaeon]
MNKKGGLILFLIILGVVAILIIGAGIYAYNFHVFKTLRVCLTEGENTNLPCENSSQCREFATTLMPEIDLSDAPYFIRSSFEKAIDRAIYCDGTCFIRNFRGMNPETQEFELLEKCEDSEIEIKVDIRGKEAVETLKWLRSRASS